MLRPRLPNPVERSNDGSGDHPKLISEGQLLPSGSILWEDVSFYHIMLCLYFATTNALPGLISTNNFYFPFDTVSSACESSATNTPSPTNGLRLLCSRLLHHALLELPWLFPIPESWDGHIHFVWSITAGILPSTSFLALKA